MMFPSVVLGDIADVTVGFVGSMASEYVSDGVPFLRSLNIEPYRIKTSDLKFVSTEFHRRLRKSSLAPGDVVIVRTGKPGTCAVIPDWLSVSNCSDLVVVRCGPQIHPRYLAYWVNSLANHHIGSNLVGAVQQHFNVGAAKLMPIMLPAYSEQEAILSVLASLDDKIELNRRMNETLEAMAQAIYRDWFVDFGPVRRKLAGATDPVEIMGNISADPIHAAELAGLFPSGLGVDGALEGWNGDPLSVQFEIIGGGTPRTGVERYWNGNIPWFSVVDTPSGSDVFVFDTEKSISEEGLESSSARLIPAGTTIISARGTVGNLAIASREMTFNQSCYALRSSRGDYPFFVYLTAARAVEQLSAMAHGSVFSTITRQTFEALSFPNPPDAVLSAAEALLAPLFDRIKSAVDESRTLAETRDYLLPRLMSGEVRVSDVALAEVH